VPNRGQRREGLRIHHSTILEEEDRSIVDGIPVTAVPRTLLDLAAESHARRLSNAIDRAERTDLLDLDAVDELLCRSGRHRGRRSLEAALEIYRDPGFTRSRAELLFLALVRRAGLPRPATNVFVAGHEIDAYWEREGFAVEVDGWDTHRTRAAFEADPVRQEDLKLAGIDSIRLTARRIEREPENVGKRLAMLLARRHGSA
jgi:very-short-patch-repair endonuclease